MCGGLNRRTTHDIASRQMTFRSAPLPLSTCNPARLLTQTSHFNLSRTCYDMITMPTLKFWPSRTATKDRMSIGESQQDGRGSNNLKITSVVRKDMVDLSQYIEGNILLYTIIYNSQLSHSNIYSLQMSLALPLKAHTEEDSNSKNSPRFHPQEQCPPPWRNGTMIRWPLFRSCLFYCKSVKWKCAAAEMRKANAVVSIGSSKKLVNRKVRKTVSEVTAGKRHTAVTSGMKTFSQWYVTRLHQGDKQAWEARKMSGIAKPKPAPECDDFYFSDDRMEDLREKPQFSPIWDCLWRW